MTIGSEARVGESVLVFDIKKNTTVELQSICDVSAGVMSTRSRVQYINFGLRTSRLPLAVNTHVCSLPCRMVRSKTWVNEESEVTMVAMKDRSLRRLISGLYTGLRRSG